MNARISATERGDLAERLVPVAREFARAVRSAAPREIHAFIGALSPHKRDALLVVLGAMVDPDVEPECSLAHVTYDEHGQPLLAPDLSLPDDQPGRSPVDEVVVERALAGQPPDRKLTQLEQQAVTAAAIERKLTSPQLASALGIKRDAAERRMSRHRNRTNTTTTIEEAAVPAARPREIPTPIEDRLWRSRAACRDKDPELWFPIGDTGPALLQIEEAKAVCRQCDVADACLKWAIESGQGFGVWGGMSEEERRALKRREQRIAACLEGERAA